MKRTALIFLVVSLLGTTPVWAAENQPMQTQNPSFSGPRYGAEDMGPGMMGPGSGYYGRGPGMMGGRHGMDRGRNGYGRSMSPDRQGLQNMTPEQREQWREMRAKFMQDTLPLRQELSAKQMELETLWDQRNPDPDKVNALSDRITELRSKLDQKHDAFLTQCRREFGDRGWTCPGGSWDRY